MADALLGVGDSLRQASLIPNEPLGLFALLTAEEEAAAFLYYALREKGYAVKDHGKLQRHPEKVKLVVFAEALHRYFFVDFPISSEPVITIESDNGLPKTTFSFPLNGYQIIQEDPLAMIVTAGDGDAGHTKAVEGTVETLLRNLTPKGGSLRSHIAEIANRRNLCIYGDPIKKTRINSERERLHYITNSLSMIILGILVFNGKSRTPSMEKLVESLFRKITEST